MALLEAFRKYIADNDLATHDDRYRLTPDTENVLRITKEIV